MKPEAKANNFWQVKNKTGQKAELLIYGEISSFQFWGDETTPKEVDDMLKAIGDVKELTVRINSPGGEVFAGMAIYNILKRHEATVTVYIDGLAASIASVIALAGDKVIAAKGSMYMIHRPYTSVWRATADKLREQADLLDKIESQIRGIYSEKTGMSDEELAGILATGDTWYTAEEAVTAGFADEVEGDAVVAACLRGDIAIINGVEVNWKQFRNAPRLPEAPPDPEPEAVDYKHKARMRELDLMYRR